jgi:hypothetical protein
MYAFFRGLIVCAVLFSAAPARAITYTVSDTVGPWSVDGTITTDGTTGTLGVANILAWAVTVNVIDPFFIGSDGSFTLGTDSTLFTTKLTTALSADATKLLWNYDVGDENLILLRTGGGFVKFSAGLFVVEHGGDQFSKAYSGNTIIATAAGLETPLPGALVLFASGVSAFGLLSWRRKRKQAA